MWLAERKGWGDQARASAEEAAEVAESLLSMTIKGERTAKVLVEQKLASKRELYISIVVDRSSKCFTLLCSSEGGVDIEQVGNQS